MNYKQEFENNKGQMLGTDETMDMKLAKELKPIKNKQIYEADAKANLVSTNVDAGRNKI